MVQSRRSCSFSMPNLASDELTSQADELPQSYVVTKYVRAPPRVMHFLWLQSGSTARPCIFRDYHGDAGVLCCSSFKDRLNNMLLQIAGAASDTYTFTHRIIQLFLELPLSVNVKMLNRYVLDHRIWLQKLTE
jgi:hypothetical protein